MQETTLEGRDGMVTSLGVNGFNTEPESASLSLSQSWELKNSKFNQHMQEVEISLGADGAGALEFSENLNRQARLEVDTHGVPELNLFDRDGKARGSFGLSDDGQPHVYLRAKGEKSYAGVAVNENGLASFDEKDKGGTYLENDGLRLLDDKDKVRAYLGRDGLRLQDERGNVRAALGSISLETVRTGATKTTAAGSLTLFDKQGRLIWKVPP